METPNKRLARKFIDALAAADVEACRELCHGDARAAVKGGSPMSGESDLAGFLRILPLFKRIMPGGLQFTIHNVIEENDRVALECHSAADMIDGKRYENDYHFLFVIRDGKISRIHEYLDTFVAMNAIAPHLAAART